MNRLRIAILLGICLVMIALSCSENKSANDKLNNTSIPVYKGAYDIDEMPDKPPGAITVFYKVDMNFPAADLISFYEGKFNKAGLTSYSGIASGDRQWESFNYKTGDWEKTNHVPARYVASWSDKTGQVRVDLFIRYEYDGLDDNWSNVLIVNLTIMDLKELNEDLNKLKELINENEHP